MQGLTLIILAWHCADLRRQNKSMEGPDVYNRARLVSPRFTSAHLGVIPNGNMRTLDYLEMNG